MLKLITLNIEKYRHITSVLKLIDGENPDVICLQEIPYDVLPNFLSRGYITIFAPMTSDRAPDTIGIAICAKEPFTATTTYYYKYTPKTRGADQGKKPVLCLFPYLTAKFKHQGKDYDIRTTHMPVTEHGKTDADQTRAAKKLLSTLTDDTSHIIAGDFNMPRGVNSLYPLFCNKYVDTIPCHYNSSLDKNLHQLGGIKLDEPIFDTYMVDYIFATSDYQVQDVRLVFGVSDHAAVVAHIFKS